MKLSDMSKEEQQMLRTVVCPEAADEHINYYLRVCAGQGVDPFCGLLYLTVRTNKGKPRPIVAASIDGARMKASRSGEYAGSDEPEFDSEDGPNPKWCRSTVYRMVSGIRCPFSAKIRWEEFKPAAPNDFQWKSKPYHMLAKCAEMSALRKGFPESVPSANEEEYAEETTETKPEQVQTKPPVTARWMSAVAAFKALGVEEPAILAKIKREAPKDVTNDDIETLFSWYEELQRQKEDEIPPPQN